VNCVRFCFWHCMWPFLFVYKISREPLNVFAPSSQRRRIWFLSGMSLNVKVKGQRSRSPAFLALSAACMQFMFGKTSLESCFVLSHKPRQPLNYYLRHILEIMSIKMKIFIHQTEIRYLKNLTNLTTCRVYTTSKEIANLLKAFNVWSTGTFNDCYWILESSKRSS